jgi:hypothetical protein
VTSGGRRGAGPAGARHGLRAALAVAAAPLIGGCALPTPGPMADPLPPLHVQEIATDPGDLPGPFPAPQLPPGGQRITFTAVDAPIREMIPLLAEAAGVSVIVDAEVEGVVTVRFQDVPALEALEAVARLAGYELRDPRASAAPFEPRTVFFVPAVNVNRLDAAGIRARFGVGREVAEWIVVSRAGG